MSTLTRIVPRTSLLNSHISIISRDTSNRAKFIAEKIENPNKETSLIDLQLKIDCWLEWGDLLQAMAADILSDSQLVKQLNSNLNYPSLPAKFQQFDEILGSNLVSDNSIVLHQQISQISNLQEDILQVKQRLDDIITTLHTSQSLLTILLAISSFFGKSGFVLEWLDDDHELIISSDGKFQELTEIINDCELFQEKINELLNSNTFKKQSEPVLIHLEQERRKTTN